jgi:hypothetical protein
MVLAVLCCAGCRSGLLEDSGQSVRVNAHDSRAKNLENLLYFFGLAA